MRVFHRDFYADGKNGFQEMQTVISYETYSKMIVELARGEQALVCLRQIE
jgi:hypothetical protein